MKVFILLCFIILPFAYGGYKIQKTKMSWQDAQKACEKWGGNLATISSLKTNAYLIKKLKASGLKEAWIGYNDLEKENSFKWITSASNVFTNWNSGEPNNSLGNEDCTEIVVGVRNGHQHYYGKWNDLNCATQQPSICQRPEYKVESKKLNWTDAEGKCVEWGGHLASITSKATNEHIALLLKSYFLKEAWIGYNDIKVEGSFEWMTSESGTFNNFNHGEPNNAANEDCAEILDGRRGGKSYHWSWNDKSCDYVLPSVCQKVN